MGKYQEEKAI